MKPESLLCLLASTLLASCSQQALQAASSPEPASTTPLPQHLQTTALEQAGEQALALADGGWLSVGRDHGLLLTGAGADRLELPDLGSEYLDSRQSGPQQLAVILNKRQLQLLAVDQHNIRTLATSTPLGWAVEGMCLYQPPGSSHLQLFVLDDRAMAHQLLLTPRGSQLQLQEIRQLPLPPQASYCVVDDLTSQLFVSEEAVGVWAYNARPESEILRTAVDLVQPWGQLQQLAGPLATANGQLLVAEPGHLHRYDIHQQGAVINSRYRLTASAEPDSLQASLAQGQLQISWLDDDNGQLWHASLPATTRVANGEQIPEVMATAETTPMSTEGDAADDPAIWVNRQQPAASRILGTNKQQGLMVYNLKGELLQSLPAGRVNNVDVRQGFSHRGRPADIAAASQRDRHAISLFAINPANGQVDTAEEIETGLTDVYGLCMYQQASEVYVFINDQDGRFEQWQIIDSPQGWHGQLRRRFAVASQPEGCAADDQQQRLFIGEEDAAVWTLDAAPDATTAMQQIATVGDWLVADIEGMDIYRRGEQSLLVVSSQGNDSYVVLNAEAPYQALARFRIGLNGQAGIDGASETDGLTISHVNLGPDYPQGLLVVQDGRNLLPDAAQNFKLVDWRAIQALLP